MYKTLHPRSHKIKEFDIEYLELPWQDEVNVHDCGIFVMRHIESYQGQDSSCWDAGFGKKNKVCVSGSILFNFLQFYFAFLVFSNNVSHFIFF